jgi:hypothetical protein
MGAFAMPVYMLEFTPKTIASLLSQNAIDGVEVDVDVYNKNDLAIKVEAKGQRLKSDPDMFRIITVHNGVTNEHDWNFTILRESADRSRKRLFFIVLLPCDPSLLASLGISLSNFFLVPYRCVSNHLCYWL